MARQFGRGSQTRRDRSKANKARQRTNTGENKGPKLNPRATGRPHETVADALVPAIDKITDVIPVVGDLKDIGRGAVESYSTGNPVPVLTSLAGSVLPNIIEKPAKAAYKAVKKSKDRVPNSMDLGFSGKERKEANSFMHEEHNAAGQSFGEFLRTNNLTAPDYYRRQAARSPDPRTQEYLLAKANNSDNFGTESLPVTLNKYDIPIVKGVSGQEVALQVIKKHEPHLLKYNNPKSRITLDELKALSKDERTLLAASNPKLRKKLQGIDSSFNDGTTGVTQDMTIKLDPNTGMYIVPELMEQGPVPTPHNFRPSPQPQGPDTVRADLTPGEAVIPAPVAQDPQFKPAIEQMVAEGRNRNAMREGTTDVPAYMGGTPQVPAYNPGTEEVLPEPKVNLRTGRPDPVYPEDDKVFTTIGANGRSERVTPEEATRREGELELIRTENLQPKRDLRTGQQIESDEDFAIRKASTVAAAQEKIDSVTEPDTPQPPSGNNTDANGDENSTGPAAANSATGTIILPDGTKIQGALLGGEAETKVITDLYNNGTRQPKGFLAKAFDFVSEGVGGVLKDSESALWTTAVAYAGGLALGYNSEDSFSYARQMGLSVFQQEQKTQAAAAQARSKSKVGQRTGSVQQYTIDGYEGADNTPLAYQVETEQGKVWYVDSPFHDGKSVPLENFKDYLNSEQGGQYKLRKGTGESEADKADSREDAIVKSAGEIEGLVKTRNKDGSYEKDPGKARRLVREVYNALEKEGLSYDNRNDRHNMGLIVNETARLRDLSILSKQVDRADSLTPYLQDALLQQRISNDQDPFLIKEGDKPEDTVRVNPKKINRLASTLGTVSNTILKADGVKTPSKASISNKKAELMSRLWNAYNNKDNEAAITNMKLGKPSDDENSFLLFAQKILEKGISEDERKTYGI